MAAHQANRTGGQTRFGTGFLTGLWYFAAMARDLARGKLQRLVVLGEPILVGRDRDGRLLGLRDVCPHRAAPLSAGRLMRESDGATSVACPYHGWRFDAGGRCLAIPSLTNNEVDLGKIRLRRFPLAESQGLVFVWMAEAGREDEPPSDPPPVFPGVVGGGPKLAIGADFAAHIDHAVAGLMDPAHGPFVHAQWWWRSQASMHAKAKQFEPSEAGFRMKRHPPSSNSRAYRLLGGRPETEISFRLPGLRWEHVTVGSRQVLALTCLTPVGEALTRINQIVWSDHPMFALLSPLVRVAAVRFLNQDAAMVNLQNQGLQHDPALMWIDDADRQARWYVALKREWVASQRERRPFVNPVEATTLHWTS